MKILFLVLSWMSFTQVFGQSSDTCNCVANLDTAIKKVESNYAGFPSKVNLKTKRAYTLLVSNLHRKASNIQEPKSCFYVLAEYIRFFKDKHMAFTYANKDDADRRIISLPADQFRAQIKSRPSSSVEGIWTNPDTSIRIAIVKDGRLNQYNAVVLESGNTELPAGLVYFTLVPHKKGFLLKQYNVFTSTDMYAKQRSNLLQLWNFQLWGREYPGKMTEKEIEELNRWRNNNNGLEFKKIDPAYALLKIPSFFNNDSKIQKLVEKNDSVIRSTANLIVDLRGNGGGNTGWIYFLSYFMTDPIRQDDTYLRTSQANVALKLSEMAPVVNNPVPAELKKYYTDAYLARLRKAFIELPASRDTFYPMPNLTIPVDSVTVYPRKIALVVDDLCGSSTEYFLYLARQSRKTTSYGTNTVGMMDYEGMSTPTPLPHSQFILTIPISKSSWTDKVPIDQTGFSPEVKLDMPTEKWIDHIRKDLPSR